MSLADAIAATLPELRAHAESRMATPCAAKVATGVSSDDDGNDVVTYSAPVYDGPCRIRNRGNATGREVESGSQAVAITVAEWHIPIGSPVVPVGAVVFIDNIARYRITQPADGDDMTARRYPVERVE